VTELFVYRGAAFMGAALLDREAIFTLPVATRIAAHVAGARRQVVGAPLCLIRAGDDDTGQGSHELALDSASTGDDSSPILPAARATRKTHRVSIGQR
jgi:hypothetical protein